MAFFAAGNDTARGIDCKIEDRFVAGGAAHERLGANDDYAISTGNSVERSAIYE